MEQTTPGPSWGAVHWRYSQDVDHVESRAGGRQPPLRLELAVRKGNGDEAAELVVGDVVVMRVMLTADRAMDYVVVTAAFAAGFEPLAALSGHTYEGGISHYRTVRDSSTVCMFDRLPAGEHAIEIRLRAIHRGHYHSGLVRAVSMLSPEFSYHAKGRAFEVK